MPPPVPPSVKDGRMIAGRPTSSERLERLVQRARPAGSSAKQGRSGPSPRGRAGGPRPWRWPLRWRRSARRRSARARPILASAIAVLSAVWPPIVGSSASGRSRGDDLLDDLRRDRLDIGRVGQLRVGHDRRRVRVDQDDPVAFVLQRLARLRAGIIEFAGLPDHDRPGADDQDADLMSVRLGMARIGSLALRSSSASTKRSNR